MRLLMMLYRCTLLYGWEITKNHPVYQKLKTIIVAPHHVPLFENNNNNNITVS